jgi:hypothetical protein
MRAGYLLVSFLVCLSDDLQNAREKREARGSVCSPLGKLLKRRKLNKERNEYDA